MEELLVRFTYGQDPNPEYRELAQKVMHETSIALQPGRWMVNLIPARAYAVHTFVLGRWHLTGPFSSHVCAFMGSWRGVQEVGSDCTR